MESNHIELTWKGPLRAGVEETASQHHENRFPVDGEELHKSGLCGPGVYLYLMRYPRMTIVYVGQASDISFRIREHLANYIGFRYPTRSANPDPSIDHRKTDAYHYSQPDLNGLNQFNDLIKNLQPAIAEIQRMRIYYFPYASLKEAPAVESITSVNKDIESILIRCVRQLEEETQGRSDHNRIINDNFRQESRKNIIEIDRSEFKRWLQRQIALEIPQF